MLTLWHNPRCSKSRQALALVEASGQEATIYRYLDEPPSAEALAELMARLDMDHPRQMMRVKEKLYRELGLRDIDDAEALLAEMAAHPILIERPILDDGAVAVIGRPPEKVNEIL